MLIQNFRIARAGVICPLTQRDRLDPRFGTRHRGALGVSEETDAFVVVVSEERGEIRVIQRGEISEPLTAADLEARIAVWLDQPRAEASVAASPRATSPGESIMGKSIIRTRLDLRREAMRAQDGSGDPSGRISSESSSTLTRPDRAEPLEADR